MERILTDRERAWKLSTHGANNTSQWRRLVSKKQNSLEKFSTALLVSSKIQNAPPGNTAIENFSGKVTDEIKPIKIDKKL